MTEFIVTLIESNRGIFYRTIIRFQMNRVEQQVSDLSLSSPNHPVSQLGPVVIRVHNLRPSVCSHKTSVYVFGENENSLTFTYHKEPCDYGELFYSNYILVPLLSYLFPPP